mgnify:CR=1 FL=1
MVVAGIALIVAIVIPQFSKIRERETLKSGVENTVGALDKARNKTLASVASSSYGVHFQSDRVVIFKGIVYSANDANNEVITLTTPSSISNVTLGGVSGSSGDVYFNRIYGTPNTTGTVTVSTGNYSKVITISNTGSASSN